MDRVKNSIATIPTVIEIERSEEFAWDAIHNRLLPGFVVACKQKGDSRVVTFVNGMAVRELIASVNDETRWHSWSGCGPASLTTMPAPECVEWLE